MGLYRNKEILGVSHLELMLCDYVPLCIGILCASALCQQAGILCVSGLNTSCVGSWWDAWYIRSVGACCYVH